MPKKANWSNHDGHDIEEADNARVRQERQAHVSWPIVTVIAVLLMIMISFGLWHGTIPLPDFTAHPNVDWGWN